MTDKVKNPLPEWLLQSYHNGSVTQEFICIVQIFLLHLRYRIQEKKSWEKNLLQPKQKVQVLKQTFQTTQFSDLKAFPFLSLFVLQCVRQLACLDPKCGSDLKSKLQQHNEEHDFEKLTFPLPKLIALTETQIHQFKRDSFYKRANEELFAFLEQLDNDQKKNIE